MLITELDENFAAQRTTRKYPYLELTNVTDVLPVVLPLLREGDCPLHATFEGVERKLCNILLSAIEIQRLLIVSELVYHKSATDCISIKSVSDVFTNGVGL